MSIRAQIEEGSLGASVRGEINKYTWIDAGSSYLPNDLVAAFLYAQLEKLDEIQRMRMKVYDAYNEAFRPYERQGVLRLPVVPQYASHNAHTYYILFNDGQTRDYVMDKLKSYGINALFHYIPLHSSPIGLKMGYTAEDLPVTESISQQLLRLPIFAGMTDDEAQYVISTLKGIMDYSF